MWAGRARNAAALTCVPEQLCQTRGRVIIASERGGAPVRFWHLECTRSSRQLQPPCPDTATAIQRRLRICTAHACLSRSIADYCHLGVNQVMASIEDGILVCLQGYEALADAFNQPAANGLATTSGDPSRRRPTQLQVQGELARFNVWRTTVEKASFTDRFHVTTRRRTKVSNLLDHLGRSLIQGEPQEIESPTDR
jgi:hypothetical protein